MLGVGAARDLGIPTTSDLTGYQVWVDGHVADVVGILHGSAGPDTDLSAAVVVPYAEAVHHEGSDQQAQLLVRTVTGGGFPVSQVVRSALRPDDPGALTATQVADLAAVRAGVSTQLGRLAAGVGLLLLVLTGLLIANTMIVSVVARTSEIGLRRALGASRSDVAGIFVVEGGLTGVAGGLAGSAAGTAAVVAVSAAYGWSSYLPWWLVLAGPMIGLVVGVGAAAQSAFRAARISPATAIRVD
jgi:putative ABC transport system permease protein